jgi:transposase-like protein
MTYSLRQQDITLGSVSEKATPSREGVAAGRRDRPDPEVSATKPRQRFSAQYKLRILNEYESLTEQGQKGAFLRREGLYHSNIHRWRQQRERGVLQGLSQKRGRKPKKKDPEQKRIDELERENAKLRDQLKKAETIIDFQKKISEILGIPQNPDENDEKPS